MKAVGLLWPGASTPGSSRSSGGITNRNFKVEVDGETYVLRIGGRDTELLGIDRYNEHEASIAACGASGSRPRCSATRAATS